MSLIRFDDQRVLFFLLKFWGKIRANEIHIPASLNLNKAYIGIFRQDKVVEKLFK